MVDSGKLWEKVGDIMLLGEYHHNIDDKNRLVIPTKYREELGDEFVITRGIEKCLYVYSQKEWEKLVEKLNTLPFTKNQPEHLPDPYFQVLLFVSSTKMVELTLPPHWLVTPV